MDHKDEFSKWVAAIEEALSGEKKLVAENMPAGNACSCGSWDCPQCFPEQDQAPGGAKPAQMCPACTAAHQPEICPVCGQPHGTPNQSGEMSPLSMGGEMEEEFDGELSELSEPTLQSYTDKAVMDPRNHTGGMDSANARLDTIRGQNSFPGMNVPGYAADPMHKFGGDDDFREPDDHYDDDNGPYGGRHDDYQSNLTRRGFEEEAPEESEVDRTPRDGRKGTKMAHIVQSVKPIDAPGVDSPFTHGEDNLDEENFGDDGSDYDVEANRDQDMQAAQDFGNPDDRDIEGMADQVAQIMSMQTMGFSKSQHMYSEDELANMGPSQIKKIHAEVMDGAMSEEAKSDKYFGPAGSRGSADPDDLVGTSVEELRNIVIQDINGFLQEAQADGQVPTDHILYDSDSADNFEDIVNCGDENLMRAFGAIRSHAEDEDVNKFIKVAQKALQLLSINEDDMMPPGAAPGATPPGPAAMPTGGATGGQPSSGGGAGNYAPGTAPTMPESIQGKYTMGKVDKDVAAMLSSLKRYDMLKESVAPVLGMHTIGQSKKIDEKKGGKPEWLEDAEKKAEAKETGKKDDKKVDEAVECKVCHETPCECKDDKKDDIKEGADQEVLNWMKRFSSLGNMKGYGR